MNINQIKQDFPQFKSIPELAYLDSTATSLKPQAVIDKIVEYYTKYSANVARGLYTISEKATEEFENVRKKVATFIHATTPDEIIFTRSTTESINLVAATLGMDKLVSGDEIAVTIMEHHSNFVPWQQLAIKTNSKFCVIDINEEGYLEMGTIVNKNTKILALAHVSNVLGTINPVKEIIKKAKEINPEIIVVVDAAQAVPHIKVDVQDLGCDFLAFSSHKMLGPTGVGVLWGKKRLLDNMTPYNYGGEMIDEVAVENSTFKKSPHRFEAGTPHIDGVIGLGASIEYIQAIGLEKIREHEKELVQYAYKKLISTFESEITIVGPVNIEDRGGIITFKLGSLHPHDIAQILNEDNICIRAGHHCAMPLHKRLGLSASSRASFYIYNTQEDVDRLIMGLKKVKKILS